MPGDALARERPADAAEVKRLGDDPIVIELTTGAATVEIAARVEPGRGKVLGESQPRINLRLGASRESRIPAAANSPA
jgi:hypothetical protein